MISPEQYSNPLLWEAFDDAVTIALQGPNILWCGSEKNYDAPTQPTSTADDMVFYELVSVKTSDGEMHDPSYDANYDVPGAYYWHKWAVAQGRQGSELYRVENTAGRYYHRLPPLHYAQTKAATVPRLAAVFSKLAHTPGELSGIADKLADYMNITGSLDEDSRIVLPFAVHNIVTQSTLLAIGEEEGGNLAEVLRRASETPLGGRITGAIKSAFGKLLIGSACGAFSEEAVRNIDPKAIADTVAIFDRMGLLGDDFWIDCGIRAGGAAVNAHLLPLLYEKLAGPDGDRILRGCTDTQQLVRSYITSVLTKYQADPTRHSMNTTNILLNVRPAANSRRNVDLGRLIGLSNSLSRQMHNMRHADTSQENIQAAIRLSDMMSVSDAFLRVLYVTRPADASFEVRARQFEQDIMHAEVVSFIREGAKQRNTQILGSAALTFPNSSAYQMVRLQTLIESGVPLADAIHELRSDDTDGQH